MPLVAGIDSSTQSCKIVVCDAETGALVREARAAHPDGTEVHPHAWWTALTEASSGLLDDVAAATGSRWSARAGAPPFATRREGMIDILADALETHVDVDALLALTQETR